MQEIDSSIPKNYYQLAETELIINCNFETVLQLSMEQITISRFATFPVGQRHISEKAILGHLAEKWAKNVCCMSKNRFRSC